MNQSNDVLKEVLVSEGSNEENKKKNSEPVKSITTKI